jgi:hypothetical protein
MKTKLILITGVANGGKTSTLKDLSGRKRFHPNSSLYIKGKKFYLFNNSNCDLSLQCWLHKVWKVKEDVNLIGTFCIDTKNEICPLNILDDSFVITELKKLNVDIYFFVLSKGRDDMLDNNRLESFISTFGEKNFYYLKDIEKRAEEFMSFVKGII